MATTGKCLSTFRAQRECSQFRGASRSHNTASALAYRQAGKQTHFRPEISPGTVFTYRMSELQTLSEPPPVFPHMGAKRVSDKTKGASERKKCFYCFMCVVHSDVFYWSKQTRVQNKSSKGKLFALVYAYTGTPFRFNRLRFTLSSFFRNPANGCGFPRSIGRANSHQKQTSIHRRAAAAAVTPYLPTPLFWRYAKKRFSRVGLEGRRKRSGKLT